MDKVIRTHCSIVGIALSAFWMGAFVTFIPATLMLPERWYPLTMPVAGLLLVTIIGWSWRVKLVLGEEEVLIRNYLETHRIPWSEITEVGNTYIPFLGLSGGGYLGKKPPVLFGHQMLRGETGLIAFRTQGGRHQVAASATKACTWPVAREIFDTVKAAAERRGIPFKGTIADYTIEDPTEYESPSGGSLS